MKSTLRALGLVAAIGSTVLVSGCGSTAGTAAVVDGRRITEDEVRIAAQQVNEQFKPQTPLTARTALMFLVVEPAAKATAEKAGIPVTSDGALRSRFDKVRDVSPAALGVLRSNIILSTLNQSNPQLVSQVARQALAMKPSINPRYGSLSADTLELQPTAPAWISTAKS